jgi:hypothetical protein
MRFDLRRICVIVLAVVSVLNAGWAVREYFHTNLFAGDDVSVRARTIAELRITLRSLGILEVDYKTDNDTDRDLQTEYTRIQYLLAPVIVNRYSSNGTFLLMKFRSPRDVAPQPGFVFVEDGGDGLVLLRKM